MNQTIPETPYVSSIIFKYGDTDNVKRDAKTLREIIARQGTSLLIDVMAENCGETAIKFNFTDSDIHNLIKSMTDEMHEALSERL
jgi:hypothetical protein